MPRVSSAEQPNRRLDVATTAFMLCVTLVCAGYVVKQRYLRSDPIILDPPLPNRAMSVEGAQSVGRPDAPNAMIIYSDFLCPACRTFAIQTLPQITKEYVDSGRLRLFFRNFPVADIHPLAERAAHASACAAEQGRFWEMHDVLFATTPAGLDESPQALRALAAAAHVAITEFEGCMAQEPRAVTMDAGSGLLASVNATPTLFLGRLRVDGRVEVKRRLRGAVPMSELREILDSLIERRSPGEGQLKSAR